MADLYTPDSNGLIVAECENLRLEFGDAAVWTTVNDGLASGNTSQKPAGQTWDRSQAARMHLDFEIPSAGDYEVWIRGNTNGAGAAFWLSAGGVNAWWVSMPTYRWWRNPNAKILTFAAGRHTLTLWSIHSHIEYDKIALQPVGTTIITQNDTALTPADSPSSPFTNFLLRHIRTFRSAGRSMTTF